MKNSQDQYISSLVSKLSQKDLAGLEETEVKIGAKYIEAQARAQQLTNKALALEKELEAGRRQLEALRDAINAEVHKASGMLESLAALKEGPHAE